jgi:ATP-binding cassette subfamily F protein 3
VLLLGGPPTTVAVDPLVRGRARRVSGLGTGLATAVIGRHCNRIAGLQRRGSLRTKTFTDYGAEGAAPDRPRRAAGLEREIAEKRASSRFKARPTASQAQSRVKQIAKLRAERELLPSEAHERTMRVRFKASLRSGETVLRLERAAKAYGDKVVYRSLDFELRRGERVALVGPNGAGKSTLLRSGLARSRPTAARAARHNVRAGSRPAQVGALTHAVLCCASLEEGADIDDVPRRAGVLGAFLFSGDDVEKRVSVLSGGEKARLALAKLLLAKANFLVLDEPTNHLDMEARDVLTEALVGYEGTLLFVSHDRRFITRCDARGRGHEAGGCARSWELRTTTARARSAERRAAAASSARGAAAVRGAAPRARAGRNAGATGSASERRKERGAARAPSRAPGGRHPAREGGGGPGGGR